MEFASLSRSIISRSAGLAAHSINPQGDSFGGFALFREGEASLAPPGSGENSSSVRMRRSMLPFGCEHQDGETQIGEKLNGVAMDASELRRALGPPDGIFCESIALVIE